MYQPSATRTLNFIDVTEERDYSDDDEELEEVLCQEENAKDLPTDCDATVDQQLQVLDSNNPSQTVRGCVNFTLYGRCFKGADCKYAPGHNDQAATVTRKWMMSKLQSHQGSARVSIQQGYRPSTSAPPRKIIQREKPTKDFE